MKLIKDTCTAKKHIPVHVYHDGMELLETTLGTEKTNDSLLVEIGDDVASTPYTEKELLQESFPDLLEAAIEEECEYIQFYI